VATSRIAESVGRVLGDRYRLTRPLGVGASAHVYVADDVTLRRRVAIKVLHPALAGDEAFLRRFRAEAQVVASLRHPGILTVFDWGEDDGAPYLVMELLDGGSLRALLDRGYVLTPAQAAAVGAEAARALDYAHRRGLVHRDIKPANLIFDDEGRVRVADFGVARALAEATWTEPAGLVVGTARYAAPEQARGEKLDGRADVYSLAVVLIEAATGTIPFAADTALGTLMARVERPLDVPDSLDGLKPILEAAGTLDPKLRLDAAGLAQGLNGLAGQLGPVAPLPLAPPVDREVIERDAESPTEYPGRPRLFDVAEIEDRPTVAEPAPLVPPVIESRPPRRRRRRIILWLTALVVVLVAGAAGVAYATGRFKPVHPVPNLQHDTVASANAVLRPIHLHLSVTGSRYQAGTLKGTILTQTPAVGRRLREGQSVHVVLSLGPQPVGVPSLSNEPVVVAEGQLQVLGLKYTASTEPSTTTPANEVINSSPPAGAMLVPGQTVTLIVSSGKPFVTVPAVASSSFAAEQAALQAVGLGATEIDRYSNTVAKGQVITLGSAPGARVRQGTVVAVQISKGPHLIPIPSVFGDSVGAASQALSSDGFAISGVAGNPLNTVTGTVPQAGTLAIFGSLVQIVTG
jgi:eukaryotic-like serine/threonine-protein kinase